MCAQGITETAWRIPRGTRPPGDTMACSSASRNDLGVVEKIGGMAIIPAVSDLPVLKFEHNRIPPCRHRFFWRSHEYRRPPVNKRQQKAPALARGGLLP